MEGNVPSLITLVCEMMQIRRHEKGWEALVDLALRNHETVIRIPMQPMPLTGFERIRVFNGKAAFWRQNICREVYISPLGAPGETFQYRSQSFQVLRVEAGFLQNQMDSKELLLPHRLKGESDKEKFIYNWDLLLKETDFSWLKNPVVWAISIQENSLEVRLPSTPVSDFLYRLSA